MQLSVRMKADERRGPGNRPGGSLLTKSRESWASKLAGCNVQ